jgi:hypothetical protein
MAGDTARALDPLERAVNDGFYPYPFLKEHCSFMEPLRETPQFAEIAARAKQGGGV